ncbi:MAG: O-methyltransferase [Bacteroidota bacterium]|nr:O-methyltransferase [Bacteroidota bacterium]
MDFLDEKLITYIEAHTKPESVLLQQLNRETWAKVLVPRMLSGHLQGQVLAMFSKMIQPRCILEVGTYTGYSALCLAEGLVADGKLITIDINEELADMVNRYVAASPYKNQIIPMTGNATEIIPGLDEIFDIVFIDADKENYSNYYDLVIDKVRKGGFIITDNVLWSGNVLKKDNDMDMETRAIDHFNNKVQSDPRVENVLFPVRDGLMVARKI